MTQLQGLLEAIEPEGRRRRVRWPSSSRTSTTRSKGRQGQLGGAIDKSAAVLDNLAGSDQEIAGIIRNLDRLFVALADRQQRDRCPQPERSGSSRRSLLPIRPHLEGTVEDVAFLSDETAGLIEDSGDDLGEAFRRLYAVVEELLSHQDALTETMRWTNVDCTGPGCWWTRVARALRVHGRQAAPGTPGVRVQLPDRSAGHDRVRANRGRLSDASSSSSPADRGQGRREPSEYIPEVYQDDLHYLLREMTYCCACRPSLGHRRRLGRGKPRLKARTSAKSRKGSRREEAEAVPRKVVFRGEAS